MSIPVEFFPPFVQAAVEAIQVWDVAKDVRLWEFFGLVVGFLNELTGFNVYFLQIQWHNYSMIVQSSAWSSATGRDNWWDGHQFLSLVHCHVLRPWGVVVVKSVSDFWPPVLWIYIWESFWSQECGWIWPMIKMLVVEIRNLHKLPLICTQLRGHQRPIFHASAVIACPEGLSRWSARSCPVQSQKVGSRATTCHSDHNKTSSKQLFGQSQDVGGRLVLWRYMNI